MPASIESGDSRPISTTDRSPRRIRANRTPGASSPAELAARGRARRQRRHRVDRRPGRRRRRRDHRARRRSLTAGIAGLVAGAVSMALGEYVSVSTQRDTERALLDKERRELAESPDEEFAELTAIYESKGLSAATAAAVARGTHRPRRVRRARRCRAEHRPGRADQPVAGRLRLGGRVHPRRAAAADRDPAAAGRVADSGHLRRGAARAGADRHRQRPARRRGRRKAVLRVVIGGALAMAVTYGIGQLLGAAGI